MNVGNFEGGKMFMRKNRLRRSQIEFVVVASEQSREAEKIYYSRTKMFFIFGVII